MKNKKNVRDRLGTRRHQKELKRRFFKRKQKKSYRVFKFNDVNKNIIDIKYSYLSDKLKYIVDCEKIDLLGPIYNANIKFNKVKVVKVPKVFSLVENADESHKFIKSVINIIYYNKAYKIVLNYSDCHTIHLGAQVYFDILLKDMFRFVRGFSRYYPDKCLLKSVDTTGYDKDIGKLLFSIGSSAIHTNKSIKYKDIEPYPLCEFQKKTDASESYNRDTKERDTTKLLKYVISSLKRMNKKLSQDRIESLAVIIGEILINAEEHSLFNHRYSIGYFKEFDNNEGGYGIFNLVILNFGETIYDKFKSEKCPRKDIVDKMRQLSKKYTEKTLFGKSINEEVLWTLYALQEEVTSVSKEKNIKRGNGSIKFIENFFNIKGDDRKVDDISRLAILSGNTSIVFDGTYGIREKNKNGETFKMMTFNDSGEISDKPDSKYVKFVKNHFPGTIISAQILINKDDLE